MGLVAAFLVGLLAGSPSATPTPTPTTTSPTTTVTSAPVGAVLGLSAQATPAGASVTPGSTADFAVDVWSAVAPASSVTVVGLSGDTWVTCPAASAEVCTVGTLPVGPPITLEVAVPVPATAAPGSTVVLTVAASAPGATGATATASMPVVAAPASPTVDTLPATQVLPGQGGLPANGGLPGVAAPGDVPGVSGSTPSPTPGTEPAALPSPVARLAAATGPSLGGLGVQLVGGGLLIAALAIAGIRIARRRLAADQGDDNREELSTDGEADQDRS